MMMITIMRRVMLLKMVWVMTKQTPSKMDVAPKVISGRDWMVGNLLAGLC